MKSAFIITILVERFIKEELFVVGVGTQKCVLQNGCWYVQSCCTGTHGAVPLYRLYTEIVPTLPPQSVSGASAGHSTNPALTSS